MKKRGYSVFFLLLLCLLGGCSNGTLSQEEINERYLEQRVFTTDESIKPLLSVEEMNELTSPYFNTSFTEQKTYTQENFFIAHYSCSTDISFFVEVSTCGYGFKGVDDANLTYEERKDSPNYEGQAHKLLPDIEEGVLLSTFSPPVDPDGFQVWIDGYIFTDRSQYIYFQLTSFDEAVMEQETAEELGEKLARQISDNYQKIREENGSDA